MSSATRLAAALHLLISLASSPVAGDQHILLDTTKESMLDWRRYPYGQEAATPGWVEESFTNFDKGINWRSYVACDVNYPEVNNWLWTPSITRHDAKRIYIEVKFSLRTCDLFPGRAVQCKETFSLLYHEFDGATRDPWEPESFKQIDVIAADEGRFTNNDEVIINTETRSVDVTMKGLYFAFRDQGACISLLAVKVYYLKCPEITVGFAHYPETATGSQLTSIERVPGTCVANAVAVQEPTNLCKADGTWSFHSGLCSCMAGYQPTDGVGCSACPVGRYKHEAGDSPCHICPAHSQALFTGAVECPCNRDFFRAPDDPKSQACTRPPSAPQALKYEMLNSTSLRLSWSPPVDEGARADTRYRVTCDVCSARVVYNPRGGETAHNSVIVSSLQEGVSYRFTVQAINGVSDVAKKAQTSDSNDDSFASVLVAGGKESSIVSHIRLVDIKPTKVSLAWSPPHGDGADVEVYEVRYYPRGTGANNASSNTVITKRDRVEINNLKEDTDYAFEVRAQSGGGWGEFSRPVVATTHADPVHVDSVEDQAQVGLAVGVTLSVLVAVCLLALVVFFVRRGSPEKRNLKDNDSIDYRGIDNTFPAETLPIVHTHTLGGNNGGAGCGNYNPFSLHKTYVDPHTYEDPNIAVKQFAKEIDAKYITIEAIIGGGEFGDVCRGRLSIPDRNDMLVAIKTLKSGSSDKAKIDFLTEASIMGQFEHPNVIFLQGVVTKANPIMIITEYMENGSLDTFLRANDGKFQVGNGTFFLSEA